MFKLFNATFLCLLVVNKLHNKLSLSSRDLYLLFFSYEVKYELVVADQTSLGKLAKATGMVSLVTPVMFTR